MKTELKNEITEYLPEVMEVKKRTRIGKILLYLTIIFFISNLTANASQKENQKNSSICEGYTLFNPQGSKTTYLIDNQGQVRHTWESDYRTGSSVYLLENGNLLRTATIKAEFSAKGGAGRIEEFSWDGELLWSYEYSNNKVYFHHDIERLPNGNTLLVAWERIDVKDVLAAGRKPNLMPDPEQDETLWMDHLIEVNKDGEIVWEWHIADHLIQDVSADFENFGVVADHPERININYLGSMRVSNDWNHVNAVDYNPELNQIMISVRTFGEIWIIDHNTTTAEAASDKGNLLYRWGNPAAYDQGDASDQQLFGQHDAKWLTNDLPGAGSVLVFNNGGKRLRPYSSIEEIVPPVNGMGEYELTELTYGPKSPIWHYQASETSDFYSDHISGAQRLPNGNTLICSGAKGRIFEVTSKGKIVWDYTNPYVTTSPRGEKNSVFRAEKYPLNYSGIKNLSATNTKENIENNKKENTDPENRIDLTEAARKLGVNEDELKAALGSRKQGAPDFKKASQVLNISESALREAFNSGVKQQTLTPYKVSINGIQFEVTQKMYGWNELPENIIYEREPVKKFINPEGETHYYEVIYVSSMNLDWYQTSYLAQEAGGYKACITSKDENDFIFNLIKNEKYWWAFPEDGGHYGIKIGPTLGGYQPEGSVEPAGGWCWLSGEPWQYSNWAKNLDDGIIDKDPRNNSQPNDVADGQPIMGFGELNIPVPTWGDYTACRTTPRGMVRGAYAFIIEYESMPIN